MTKFRWFFLCLLIPFLSHAQSWKQAATDSILKYRTSPVQIKVVDSDGMPVRGVSVHVKMLKHSFKWGTTVNINEVSRIISKNGSFDVNSPYINHFRYFNSVTPDNAGKWKGWIDPSQRSTYLKTIEWLDSLGIANRGHTCVWESERFNAIPDILIGQEDTSIVRSLVKSHITNVMSTLSDKLYEIDVVNELIHEQHIVRGMLHAPDPALEHSKWYKWARQAAPDVGLIANEFDLFQSGNNFYQKYITYVNKMIDDGAPVDGVGMQGHFWSSMPSWEELKKRINRVKPLGLPMAVTEFDMVGRAYDDMERVMFAVFSEPQIYGFTMWGAWDGSQWRKNGPLFEEDWDLKPSGQAWLDLVHGEWWTDTTLVTDESGIFDLLAFKGTHTVELMMDDKIYVDTFLVEDGPVSLSFSKNLIKSNIPSASIIVENELEEYNVYQPAFIKILSDYPDSIAKVEFKSGLFVEYTDRSPEFNYDLTQPFAGEKELFAKVTFKNGYSVVTDTLHFKFVNKNAFPIIQTAYPFNNQFFMHGNDVTVSCEPIDYDGEIWKVELSGLENGMVLTDTAAPFVFTLQNLAVGSYQLELKALDSLYSFDKKTVKFNVVDPEAQNISVSTPLSENHDVEELADGSIEMSGDLDMGEKLTGIYFQSPGIPSNATIDSAFLQFTVDKASFGAIEMPIYAELSARPQIFSNNTNNLQNRENLTSSISWAPGDWEVSGENGPAQRTPDLRPIIEDLVSLDEWDASNPMLFILGLGQTDAKRRAVSYDLNPENAPKLIIYYSGGFDLANPEPPTGLHISSKQGDGFSIKWDEHEDKNVIGYFIYVDGKKYLSYAVDKPGYTFENLSADAEHTIHVTAISKLSIESLPGNSIQSNDEVHSGIKDNDMGFKVYPNPFSSGISISLQNNSTIRQVDIIDMFGKTVYMSTQISSDHFMWNGKDPSGKELANGIYFLNIYTNNSIQTIKIIKSKN